MFPYHFLPTGSFIYVRNGFYSGTGKKFMIVSLIDSLETPNLFWRFSSSSSYECGKTLFPLGYKDSRKTFLSLSNMERFIDIVRKNFIFTKYHFDFMTYSSKILNPKTRTRKLSLLF